MKDVKVSLILTFFVLNVSISFAQSFTNLGSGLIGYPRTLYADTSSGILYVGGNFMDAGGVPVQHIAKWDGLTWDSIGGSIFWAVKDIEKFKDTIYAVSDLPGGVQKWDGTIWKDIGNTVGSSTFGLFATDSILYISGWFDTIGGINTRYMAYYNGNNLLSSPSSFADPGWGAYNSIIYNNDLFIAGNFENTQNPSISDMTYLHNSTWLPIGNGIQSSFGTVNCFTIFQNKLVIGGTFQTSWGDPGNSIMMWDGTNLTQLGSGLNGDVFDMVVYNNELYVGGSISSTSGVYGSCLQKWNGTQWDNLGLSFNNTITSLALMNNELYVGGGFTQVNGTPINRIMKLTLPVNDQIIDDESRFAIYPNPNQCEFFIEGETAIDEIDLLDVSGKFIESIVLENEINPKKVKLNNVSSGIYILKLKFNSGVYYRKIIVN